MVHIVYAMLIDGVLFARFVQTVSVTMDEKTDRRYSKTCHIQRFMDSFRVDDSKSEQH